jgi:hypothetical protein
MLSRTSESPRSDFGGPKASQQRLRGAASGPCRKAAKGKVGRLRLPVPQGSEAALSCLGPDFRLCPGEDSPRRATTSTTRLACSRHRHPSPGAGSAMARHLPCWRMPVPTSKPSRPSPSIPVPRCDFGIFCGCGCMPNGVCKKVPELQRGRPSKTAPWPSGLGKTRPESGPTRRSPGHRGALQGRLDGALFRWMGPARRRPGKLRRSGLRFGPKVSPDAC